MNKKISHYIFSLLLSVYFRSVDVARLEMITKVQNSFVSIVVFWVPVSTCARLLPFEPSMVVYHLRGKTGWSTVCSNGKRKSPMQNFDQDWRVPFAQPLLNDT